MSDAKLTPEQQQEIERLLRLANLQKMRKQWGEAEGTCEKALEIAPNDHLLIEMLADLEHESGKLDKALEGYKKAMQLAPNKPALEKKYAMLTLEIGEREHQKFLAKDMLENPRKYVRRQRSPFIALALSIVPGFGQLYNGEVFKACIVFGSFLLLMLTVVLFQSPMSVTSTTELLRNLDPPVQVMGFIFLAAWMYGIIDAPLAAEKSSKADKKQIA